jgi:hypothetical protein
MLLSKYYLMERATRVGSRPVNAQLSNTIFINPCYSANNACLPHSSGDDDNYSAVYFASEAGTYTQSGERNNVSYF